MLIPNAKSLQKTKSSEYSWQNTQTCNLRIYVVFKGQDDGVWRGLESTLCYGFNHFLQSRQEWLKTQNWTQSLSTGFVCWKLLHSKFFTRVKNDTKLQLIKLIKRKTKTSKRAELCLWHFCSSSHLKGDLSGHGEPVGDVGFFILWSALPAVQLNTATTGEQHLPIHLHRRIPGQLAH